MGLADIRRESILGLDNIRLDLPVAGLGSRSLAAFLDYLILLAVGILWSLFVAFLVSRLSPALAAVLLLGGLFLLQWGYFAGLEIAMGGRTPGKRALRLRVVTAAGGTPGVAAFLLAAIGAVAVIRRYEPPPRWREPVDRDLLRRRAFMLLIVAGVATDPFARQPSGPQPGSLPCAIARITRTSSLATYEERLRRRGTEKEEAIKRYYSPTALSLLAGH